MVAFVPSVGVDHGTVASLCLSGTLEFKLVVEYGDMDSQTAQGLWGSNKLIINREAACADLSPWRIESFMFLQLLQQHCMSFNDNIVGSPASSWW